MVLIGFYLSNLLAYGDCLSYVLFIIRFVLSGKGRGCEVPAFFDFIKKGRNFVPYSTPSHFVTAPEGHWGPDSPDPLRRSAPREVVKRMELVLSDQVQKRCHRVSSHNAAVRKWCGRSWRPFTRTGRAKRVGRHDLPAPLPPTKESQCEKICFIVCGFCKSRCSLELCACSARWCREGRR